MEYHKLIYHRFPSPLEMALIMNVWNDELKESAWAPKGEDNAAPYGFIWHVGFPPGCTPGWPDGWDGFIVDDEPNGFGEQRWRVNHINHTIECEEV